MNKESLEQKLAAVNQIIEDAASLTRAQEKEVARMRAAGLDSARAEALLEAYRWSARIAAERKQDLEVQIAHRPPKSS